MDILKPEGLSFWTIIVFVILLFLLTKYAWKPILKAIKEREKSINDALASAEEAKKEMANWKADNEKLLAQARAERDAMLKEAREIKDKIVNQAKEEAQLESQKIITQAKISIENEKKTALAELKNQVADISLEIAQKVISKELSSQTKQEELIGNLLNDITLK